MKDILGYILPMLWRYSENLLLMIANPFKISFGRSNDEAYFKDSVVFLIISCILAALLAGVIVPGGSLQYSDLFLTAFGNAVTIMSVSISVFLCWYAFGHRGSSKRILMPFLYSGSTWALIVSALGLVLAGASRIYSPLMYQLFTELTSNCDSGGPISAAFHGNDLSGQISIDIAGRLLLWSYLIASTFFLAGLLVGAYRTALSVFSRETEFGSAFLIMVSLLFAFGGLYFSEIVYQAISGAYTDC